MNSRLTPKDRNLIKGAIRRAFSRSALHKSIMDRAKISGHTDPSRPRVKTWHQCESCTKFCAGYELQIDHIAPVIPVDSSMEQMSLDSLVDRTWCDPNNLQAICIDPCHTIKSTKEREQRKAFKNVKSSKNAKIPTSSDR